jgi:signal transduction histidine kinase
MVGRDSADVMFMAPALRFRRGGATLRIVAAALALAVVLGGALAIVVERGAASGRATEAARQGREENAALSGAVSAFWQEREAAGEYLVAQSRGVGNEVLAKESRFETAVAAVARESPSEAALLSSAVAGNRRLFATFHNQRGLVAKADSRRAFASLNRGEAAVLGPLAQLTHDNVGQYLSEESLATTTEREALIAEIVGACIALLAGVWFILLAIRLVRRVEHQNAELLEADRLKDEFISTVSHELRTPITSVQGYVDVLLDGDRDPVTPEQRESLTIVHRNVGRLLRLVNDLLLAAQAKSGKLEIETQRVDVVELARHSVERLSATAASNALELTFTTSSCCAWVEADPARIDQAIDNLLSNALKFTTSGGEVGLDVAAHEERVTLTVTDTGVGMSAAEVGQLFDRFFRTDGARGKQIQGIGLGLTIARAIVEAHGGTITVESEPDAGTSFVITLPLASPLADPVDRPDHPVLANAA